MRVTALIICCLALLFSFTSTTEELADLSHSFLMRGGKMLPVDFQKLIREGDQSQTIHLEPDDLIYLPSSMTNEVYVLGAVTEPRPVGFVNEMNLITALVRSLGIRPEADRAHITIVRGSLTEPKIATVNARDIIQSRATNVRLEPGDILYVPGRGSMSPRGFCMTWSTPSHAWSRPMKATPQARYMAHPLA